MPDKGKTARVLADAEKIVRRFRDDPFLTVTGLMAEYETRHETIMRAILSMISDAEYYELRRQRKYARHAKRHIDAKNVAAERAKKKKAKAAAAEARHIQIHQQNIIKLRGETTVWFQCTGCGYDSAMPVIPCPKCNNLCFERIEQPIELARRAAANQ